MEQIELAKAAEARVRQLQEDERLAASLPQLEQEKATAVRLETAVRGMNETRAAAGVELAAISAELAAWREAYEPMKAEILRLMDGLKALEGRKAAAYGRLGAASYELALARSEHEPEPSYHELRRPVTDRVINQIVRPAWGSIGGNDPALSPFGQGKDRVDSALMDMAGIPPFVQT